MASRMLRYLSVEVWLNTVLQKRPVVLVTIAAITLFFPYRFPI